MSTDDRETADGFVLTAAVLALKTAAPPATTDVDGGSGNDPLTGTAGADTLRGLDGIDTLLGLGGNDRLEGGNGNDSLDGGTGVDTLIGGAGNDTYVVDVAGDLVTETGTLATEIDTVRSGVSFTLGANLERLVLLGTGALSGTGNLLANTITGNDGANVLSGGDGNDTLAGGLGDDTLSGGNGADSLTGGSGADLLTGGAGNDAYVVDATDLVSELGTSTTEIDTVVTAASLTLGANLERLVLSGTAASGGFGNTLANTITGNGAANVLGGSSGNDTLLGNAGDDTLSGGTGSDSMTGGAGNDTYAVDAAGDVVVETGTSLTEIDTVNSTVTFTLAANVEVLVLGGALALNGTGNTLANRLTGNAAANSLVGGAGNDTLVGNGGNDTLGGGSGNDSLVGGAGNDIYAIDSAGDVVVETGTLASEVDRVNATVSHTLAANVEQLTLQGSTGLAGTGNTSANQITGNSGANLLAGLAGNDTLVGGAGNDTLEGGTGNDAMDGGAGADRYVVSGAGDTVTESSTLAGEIDTVVAGVSFMLGANLENLALTGTAGLVGTGNALANRITGGAGADTLSGLAGDDTLDGGGGADSLAGGTGNDRYLVGAGDVVVEAAGAGTDRVVAALDWTLAAEVEELELTGSADAAGTGNTLANLLLGNAGANALAGGAGDDTLVGSAGSDTLAGGSGDDLYSDAAADDQLVEASGGGTDTVTTAAAALTLAAELEVLQFTGTGGFAGTGNALANRIVGGAGDDTLDGAAGADRLDGGAGDDVYVVDDAGDAITDSAGAADEVRTTLASLTLGTGLERLAFTGSGDFEGIGNTVANRIEGGAGNDLLAGREGIDTLVGGAGDDTYQVQLDADALVEEAGGGTDLVVAQGSWTLGAEFENLVITGAGTGTGNAQANLLTGETGAQTFDGRGGDDTLDGGQGVDTLDGGEGSDSYVTDGLDLIADSGTGAFDIDTVTTSATLVLGASIEDLLLASGAGAISGTGNAADNRITGNEAANTLTGGSGNDTLEGGAGSDTYSGVDAGDVVTEGAGGGDDLVTTLLTSYTLAAQVERLSFIGVAGNYAGNGNDAANTLTGTAGSNDTLDGLLGADTMIGLEGDDVYFVDNAGDVVTEAAASGTDEIRTTRSMTIATDVEKLTYLGTAAFVGNGAAGNETITGGAGNDILDGKAGADRLVGGLGNDSYVVDDAGDVVSETSTLAGEIDTVSSSVDLTLGSNLENLTLTGTAVIDGTGNVRDNVILGNSSDNVLVGAGGNDSLVGNAGNDTLDGGSGDDTLNGVLNGGTDSLIGGSGDDLYVVTTGDTVTETNTLAAEIDTVQASISYTLGSNLENLVLSGAGDLAGTGNSLANDLTGNDGDNTLTGAGGADQLAGGLGADRFVFATTTSMDTIADFVSLAANAITHDQLAFDMSVLGIGNGDTVVDSKTFWTSAAASWSAGNELVVFTPDVAALDTVTVAASIEAASGLLAVGLDLIFVRDDGTNLGIYRFTSADGNATVSAAELTWLGTLSGVTTLTWNTTTGDSDFLFVA